MVKFCPKCGNELSNFERCSICGTLLNSYNLSYFNHTVNNNQNQNSSYLSANNQIHLEFYWGKTSWVLDGNRIIKGQNIYQISDVSFVDIDYPDMGNRSVVIKVNGQIGKIKLPYNDELEANAKVAVRYIAQLSGCSSKLQNEYTNETRLQCNVCKRIFCIQGNINTLNGVKCPSCNSMSISYLDSIDAPDKVLNWISFFIPIVGLVLYLVNIKETPIKAKKIGRFALIGFVLGILIYFSIFG